MSATIYIAQNGAIQTTAAPVKVTTGAAIKTMLQVATPSTVTARIVEWGISFDTPATASIINCELIQTDVAATVTAFTPEPYNDPNSVLSLCVGGTSATGFTASAEGTTTVTRTFDLQTVVPPAQYVHQWPLGREPVVAASKFLRIRVTATVACNCYCWILWEE